jgi:pimeloyl-ACP methyl ester carboxylesterase
MNVRWCSRGTSLHHVSTAESARDLDLVRQAVGDPSLSYLGLSYGTFLGATYANLFPGNVRALVLDGNVAPSARTRLGKNKPPHSLSMRIGSTASMPKVQDAMLELCGQASTSDCPFSAGSPEATEANWNAFLDDLHTKPIVLVPGNVITYADLLDQFADLLDVVRPYKSAEVSAPAGTIQGSGVASPPSSSSGSGENAAEMERPKPP